MTRFYIFLDVDGVLHPANWQVPGLTQEQEKALAPEELTLAVGLRGLWAMPDGPLFSRLPLLEKALQPYLGEIEIVITSSWRRRQEAYQVLLDAFSPDVRARIAGITPVCNSDFGRSKEINVWLRESGNPEVPAIVLDDDELCDWGHLTKQSIFFKIQTEQGFVEEDRQCLQKVLSLGRPQFNTLRETMVMSGVYGELMRCVNELLQQDT